MRLGRPVGVVSITSSAARSTGTGNDGAGRRLVVSLLRLGLNRAPVRLLSSPYILLSVGLCRALSVRLGSSSAGRSEELHLVVLGLWFSRPGS